jgi:hypothetical protein
VITRTSILILLLTILGAALTAAASAQVEQYDSLRRNEMTVVVSRDSAILIFPPMDLGLSRCRGMFATDDSAAIDYRQWYVVMDFKGAQYPYNHMTALWTTLKVPASKMLRSKEVEKQLGRAKISVGENRGEPPMPVWSRTPARSRVEVRNARVKITILDSAAIRGFLAPGRDSVSAGWCYNGKLVYIPSLPLRHLQ